MARAAAAELHREFERESWRWRSLQAACDLYRQAMEDGARRALRKAREAVSADYARVREALRFCPEPERSEALAHLNHLYPGVHRASPAQMPLRWGGPSDPED